MKLVDDPEEQRTLEELLDTSKPPVPPECRDLHWLLFTPFRYEARSDSRFRRAGRTPPVFYAGEAVNTAAAEIAFWRLLFFAESPATPWPANPLELTAFAVRYQAALCLDLTRPPYDDRLDNWTHPTDYAACHAVADEARDLEATAIRSVSARDPDCGRTMALLSCETFVDRAPIRQQSWRMKLSTAGVYARCEAPATQLVFGRGAFARDPRIAAFDWERGS
ncbi:MAG: RES domain-containing protein [Alphaproteobacteria bacterium]|jgi:hypothetical protein|nr:RES domain-containing protein [Alphaproteobacteria bacterium]